MPTFSAQQVTSPFPTVNELLEPLTARAQAQSLLGTLDINREKLGLERDKLAREQAAGEAWLKSGDGTTSGTTGTSAYPAVGVGGSFLSALAKIESGDTNIVSGVDKDNQGRTVAQGGNASEISQGHFQIHTGTWRDFAPRAGVDVSKYPNAMSAPREIQAQVASVIPFSRFGPRTQRLMREQFGDFDSNRTVGELAGLGPRVAPAAPGARAAAPPVVAAPISPPVYNPKAGPRVAQPAPDTVAPPVTTGQADDANTAAVKQASAALLNMPEAEAAAAYPVVVKELQARGYAMNAPPTYPGHAALQAIVGGGEPTPPAVEPSRIALRTGGTDVAGPGAGTPPPTVNQLYETGLPGVQVRGPTNTLAPQQAPAAPVAAPGTGQPPAAPVARPPLEPPPPAPSRGVQREQLIQSGPGKDLTPTQFRTIGAMISSGAPIAGVMAHAEQWRQANIAGNQQAATAAAVEADANYRRQVEYRNAQIAEQKAAADQAHREETERIAKENLRLTQEGGGRDAERLRLAQDANTRANKEAEDRARVAGETFVPGTGIEAVHENTLQKYAAKMARGEKLTDDEQRLYDGAYYALQQTGGQTGVMTDPNNPGRQIPFQTTRRLAPSLPEPKSGALPAVISQPGAAKDDSMTVEQGRAGTFAGRMQVATPVMDQLDDITTYKERGLERAGKYVGYNINSPEYQRLRIAQEAFLSGVIRQDSGAAVKQDEWDRYAHLYFPMPGDDVETLKLKKRIRQAEMEGMLRAAGPNYKPVKAVEAKTAEPVTKELRFDANGKLIK